jgi:hypothetical protein
VNSDDRIEEHPVTLGLETSTEAQVTSGLTDGEQVVVSDRSGLKPGERAKPQIVEVLQYQEQEGH